MGTDRPPRQVNGQMSENPHIFLTVSYLPHCPHPILAPLAKSGEESEKQLTVAIFFGDELPSAVDWARTAIWYFPGGKDFKLDRPLSVRKAPS